MNYVNNKLHSKKAFLINYKALIILESDPKNHKSGVKT